MISMFKGIIGHHSTYVKYKHKRKVVETLIECLKDYDSSYIKPLKASWLFINYSHHLGDKEFERFLRSIGKSLYNVIKYRYDSLRKTSMVSEDTIENLYASKSNYASALIGAIIGAFIGFFLPKK
jgi:hypothetical protein